MSDQGKIHNLKIWPEYFELVSQGKKTFEARKDDRGYSIGDILYLTEWDHLTENYTGRSLMKEVTYILRPSHQGNAVRPGYCIMSIKEAP